MLDTEVDRGLRSDIQDCLNSMLQTLAPDDLTHWLGLSKNVLSAAKTEDERKGEKGWCGLYYLCSYRIFENYQDEMLNHQSGVH